MKKSTIDRPPVISLDEAARRLGVSADDVLFLGACGVLEKRKGGVSEPSLDGFIEEATRAAKKDEALAAGVERVVIALRSEWDRALVARGPERPRRIFGAVPLGEHPDGTLVFAVESALDRIVSRNLHVLGGGRVRQLIVDASLMERWGTQPDLLEAVAPELIDLVPREVAHRHRIVPVERRDSLLIVAAAAPVGWIELDDLRFQLGVQVDFVIVLEPALAAALVRYYGHGEHESIEMRMAELTGRSVARHDLESFDIDYGDDKPEPAPETKKQARRERLDLVDGLTTDADRPHDLVATRAPAKVPMAPPPSARPATASLPIGAIRPSNPGSGFAAPPPPPPPPPPPAIFDPFSAEAPDVSRLVSTEEVSVEKSLFDSNAKLRACVVEESVEEAGETEAFELAENDDDESTGELDTLGVDLGFKADRRDTADYKAFKTEYAPQEQESEGSFSRREAPAYAPEPMSSFQMASTIMPDVLPSMDMPPMGMPPTDEMPSFAMPAQPVYNQPPHGMPVPQGMPVGRGMPMPAAPMPMHMPMPTGALARSKGGGVLGAMAGAAGGLVGGVAFGMAELAKDRVSAASPAKPKAAAMSAPGSTTTPPKEDDEPETFERKATVRYYSQMYARQNYPLLVVVSKRAIQKIVKQHVAQVEGKKSFKIRRGNPFVTIRPILPGCLCVPPEMSLNVKPKVAEAKFWVTPTAEGELTEARVEVLYEGKVVSTIDVPTRVTTQALAKVTGSAAFLTTTAGPFFEAFGVSVKKESASFIADVLAHLAGGSFRYGIAGVLAFFALAFFLKRRPKAGPETEGFFDWGVEDEVEGDPLVKAVKAKLVVVGPEGRDVVDLIHASTLVGSAQTAHVRVKGARSLSEVACELRYDDTFVLRARTGGIKVNGEDVPEGAERKLGRDAVIDLDSGRITLWLLDLRQDPTVDDRRDPILEGLVRARPSFEKELRAVWKRLAAEPVRASLLEAMRDAFADPHGWQRVREALKI